ncbi:MAG: LapA family protein [Actinomycetia bacterium]|nr:LapA family protein [Actinomycetes bacterium]
MNEEYDEYLDRSSSSNKRIAILVLAIAIVAVAAAFITQNTENVSVDFLFLSGQAPLYVVIIISMALGSLLTMVLGGLRRRRNRRAAM